MKTTNPYTKIALLFLAAAMFTAASARADTYSWTNFQSDIAGVAQHTDPNLVNPWGMSVSRRTARFGSATTAPVFRPFTGRTAQPFTGRDDSNRRAEQRNRQSHWTSLQQHRVLPSDKKWKLGTRFFHFCQ